MLAIKHGGVSRKSKISKFVALQVSIIPTLSFQVHSPKKKKKINSIDIIEAVKQQCSWT